MGDNHWSGLLVSGAGRSCAGFGGAAGRYAICAAGSGRIRAGNCHRGFYFQDPMVAALADYDFTVVFRRVRAHTGWSQQTLAILVGLDQSRISAIERGVDRLRDVALVAQVATALWIPPVLLGFGATVGDARGDVWKLVSWVDR